MKTYLLKTKDMSLYEKVSLVENKIPHILEKRKEHDIDLHELESILKPQSDIFVCENEYMGEAAALTAIKSVMGLLGEGRNIVSLESINGIVVHFIMHPNYSLFDISDAMSMISDLVLNDVAVLFGIFTSYDVPENYIKATVISIILTDKSKCVIS